MKRFSCFLLAILMLLSLAPVATADSSNTLTVQTRTAQYTFKVGETFTYSYWLRLTPDLVNYSEDYLVKYITDMADDLGVKLPGASLGKLQLGTLTKMKLKSAGGNIKYDTDCLTLVSASMPNTKKGYTVKKTDALAGSLVDSGVLDFTNSDLGFWTGKVNDTNDQTVFQNTNVLVTCKFKVTKGSDTPVYLRTRLRHLEVTTSGMLGLTQGTDIVIVHRDQSVFIPYESYETINDEQPTVVLKSLVDDVGLDIRYFNTAGDKDDYKRPGAGVAVNMYGMTTDGRYIKLSAKTTGNDVTWFYDVPYGQYYVNCSFTNANGNIYATPDPEKAEHINVPATGEVQALWLVRTDPETQKKIDVTVNWVGDEGYLPVRPDYLVAELKASDNSSVLHKRLIERDQTSESFDCVDIYDADGNAITYDLSINAVYGASQVASGSSVFPYTVTIDKTFGSDGAEDFTVTLVYCGDKSDLGVIKPDANGHYWVEQTSLRTEPSCTTDGRAYYICSACHQTKYETIPATGHKWDSGKVTKAAGCETAGEMTYTCSVCSAKRTEAIAAKGHSYTTAVTAPTCTAQGYTTHTCSVCKSFYKDNYINALGHSFKNGKCTRCGATDPNYIAAPALSITTSSGKPKLSWNAVDGAVKYWVYRSTDGKNFSYYDKTTNTTYTNSSTTIGTTYYYKVKAVNANGAASAYSVAKSIQCKPAAPSVSIYRTNGKPQLKWSAVTGATKYWIYRSTDGVNFKYFDSTTKTSYTNSGAASGTKYYYRVKAVAVVNGSNVASANSSTKSLMTTLATPSVSITTSNGKPKLTWKAVTGADKYYVYRSTDGKTFKYWDSTTKTTYINSGAKKNTNYYYKVKAVCASKSNANSAQSSIVSIKATK